MNKSSELIKDIASASFSPVDCFGMPSAILKNQNASEAFLAMTAGEKAAPFVVSHSTTRRPHLNPPPLLHVVRNDGEGLVSVGKSKKRNGNLLLINEQIILTNKGHCKRLFFAWYKTLTSINKASEKAAPPVSSHSTKQAHRPFIAMSKAFSTNQSVHVRWPGKTRGALVFALNFWFFWFKPKEQ